MPESPVSRIIDLAVVAAMANELGELPNLLEDARWQAFHGERLATGKVGTKTLLLGTLGLGKVNAAITMAGLLERFTVSQVWHVGSAGAYPQGPLTVGDVLVTEHAWCGDEGVLTARGGLPQQEIGIPLLVADGRKFFDSLPVDENVLEWARACTPAGPYRLVRDGQGLGACRIDEADHGEQSGGPRPANAWAECFHLAYGPSLTVSMASGDAQVAAARFQRYRAWAENMEGSAVAQTCLRFGVPMIECRGISNQAGERGKEHWRLDDASGHCLAIVRRWLAASCSIGS
jgi:futalosine hydrolase